MAVWLPARAAQRAPARVTIVTEAPEIAGTALIVDDEDAVRRVMARMLRRIGFDVAETENGPDALAWLERHRDEVGLVVLDLRMPGMDGWTCLRELRAMRTDPDLHPETRSHVLSELERRNPSAA